MANNLYGKGREGFLDGSIDWDTNDIKVALVDSAAYSLLIDTDDNYNDVSAGTIALSGNLASKTKTLGVADAANITYSSVTGDESEYLVGFADSGSPATSRLIFNIATATGLPVTPNGGDITVAWDDGANKIFKL